MSKMMGAGTVSPENNNKNYSGGRKGTPPMGKEKKDNASKVIETGTQHMSGRNYAGPQTPGQSTAGGAKSATKDNLSGKGHMEPQMYAGPQEAGQSAPGGAFKKGPKFCAEGGKGPNNHMFGKQTAARARPA